jgi:tetratricopeptide (TPR) repeat protein
MARQDPLHQLIRGLEKGEIRHFRLLARMHYSSEKRSDYEELFDLMAAQEQYDEAEIVSRLSNKVFAGNVSSGKNYLYKMILKSLRHYYAEENIYFQVREMWMDAFLLMRKGLHKQAIKILQKAMKLCSEKGLYASYFDFSQMKRNYEGQYANLTGPESLDQIKEAEQVQYIRLGRLLTSNHISALTETAARGYFLSDSEWEEIKESYSALMIEMKEDGQVKHDVLTYYQPLVKYHNLKKEYDKSFEIQEEILRHLVYEDNTLMKALPRRYFAFCVNFFNVCILLLSKEETASLPDKYSRMEELLQYMKQVQPKSIEEGLFFKSDILYSEVLYYTLSEKYEGILDMKNEPVNILKEVGHLMPLSKQWATCINIASAYMYVGRFSEALDWLNIIFQDQDNETHPFYQLVNRLYMMVCHIELGNTAFLEHLERNIVLFIRHQNPDFKKRAVPPFNALRKYIYLYSQGRDTQEALLQIQAATQKEISFTSIHRWALQKLAAM